MAKNIDTIASRLGAKVIAQVPEVGGGAFGAPRLARIIEQLRSRLVPLTVMIGGNAEPAKRFFIVSFRLSFFGIGLNGLWRKLRNPQNFN